MIFAIFTCPRLKKKVGIIGLEFWPMLANRKAAEQMLVRLAGQKELQRTCDSVTKLFQNSMYAYHHFVFPLAPII